MRAADSLKTTFVLVTTATIAFIAVTGGVVIFPSNIAWLQQGDLQIHYLGWLFYKNSAWAWPLGTNPGYGLELSSTIVFSDSLPLFSVFFKIFNRWLPDIFQFYGIWYYCCFLLQTFTAWKLVGLITERPFQRFLGTNLFVFSPVFLWHFVGQTSLCGQWLVLAALYLCLANSLAKKKYYWALILSLSSLVHAYLFAMVAVLWGADLLKRKINNEEELLNLLVELFGCIALSTIIMMGIGYFVMQEMAQASGFGVYRMNLLSLVDSGGWSFLIKDIDEARGSSTGFNYLGLGTIILFNINALFVKRLFSAFSASFKWFPIILVSLGLLVLSLSNNICIGSYELFSYSLPESLNGVAAIFRASGRMFWPVYYLLLWCALRGLLVVFSPKTCVNLLVIITLAQIFDTSSGWAQIRKNKLALQGNEWNTPFKSEFWQKVPDKYEKIRILPVGYNKPDSRIIAYFAAMNKMETDAVQAARADMQKLVQAVDKANETLKTGVYEESSLYVFNKDVIGIEQLKNTSRYNLVTVIDGFGVVAPNWYDLWPKSSFGNFSK